MSMFQPFCLSTHPRRPALCVVKPGKFDKDPAKLRQLLLGKTKSEKSSSQTTNLPKLEQVIDFDTSRLHQKLMGMVMKANTPQAAPAAAVGGVNNEREKPLLLPNRNLQFSQISVTNQLVGQSGGGDTSVPSNAQMRELLLNSKNNKSDKNGNDNKNSKESKQTAVSNLFNTAKGYFRLALCMGNYAFYTFYPGEPNSFCVLLFPIPSQNSHSGNPLYVVARHNEDYGLNCMNGLCEHGKNGKKNKFCPQYWRTLDFMDKNEFVAFLLEQIGGSSVVINGGNYARELDESIPKHPKFDDLDEIDQFNPNLKICDLISKKDGNLTESEVQLKDLILSLLANEQRRDNNSNKRIRNNSKKAQFFMDIFKIFDPSLKDLSGFLRFIRMNRESNGLCFQVNIGFNKVYFEPVLIYTISIDAKEWMFGYALVLNNKTNEYEVRGILNDYIIRQNNLLLNATCDDNDKLIKYNKQYRSNILIGGGGADSDLKIDVEDEKSANCVTIDSSSGVSDSLISAAPTDITTGTEETFDHTGQNGGYAKAQMVANLRKITNKNNIDTRMTTSIKQVQEQDDSIVKKENNNNNNDFNVGCRLFGSSDVNAVKQLSGIISNLDKASDKPQKNFSSCSAFEILLNNNSPVRQKV